MPKLFLSLLLISVSCQVFASNEPEIISNRSQDIARSVYIGSDENLPIDDVYRLSITPKTDGDQILIPQGIKAALFRLEEALPHWYLIALKRGSGDFECIVSVNNVDYNLIVEAWIESSWELEDNSKDLVKEFASLGFSDARAMAHALHAGLCEKLRTDRLDKAIEVVEFFGKQ